MRSTKLLLMLAMMILSSCSYKITSINYSEAYIPKKNDLVYLLNKTVLEVAITYNVKESTNYVNGIPKTENPIYSIKAVEIIPKTISDENEVYIARGKNNSHRFFLKEKADFEFTSLGTLKAVSSDYEDESPDVLESLIKTSANITKAVMLAGDDREAFIKELDEDIERAYRDLQVSIRNGDEKASKALQKKLDLLYELLDFYKEKNKSVIKNSEVMFKLLVDPDDYPWNGSEKLIKISPETAKIPTDVPWLTLKITKKNPSSSVNKEAIFGDAFRINEQEFQIPGLIYRIPAINKIEMIAGYNDIEVKLNEQTLALPQEGNYAFVPVASKLFSSKKTELAFDAVTGTLTSFKVESGSSGAKLSKSLENSASSLLDAINYINYDLEIKDLEHQKKVKALEKALMDEEQSELDSLKNEFELIKLKSDISDFGNTEKSELEQLKEELEILKLQLEIEKLKNN